MGVRCCGALPNLYLMSAACLNDIVTLGICPDEAASKSGLTLMQAAGISIKNLANTANETYVSGTELAMEKKSLALTLIKNDLIGAMQANNVVSSISEIKYDTSIFSTASNTGNYAGLRGVSLHKNRSFRGNLRKTKIKQVQCYPLVGGDNILSILDGTTLYTWDVTLIANQVNTFDETNLSGFPFTMTNDTVRVMFDDTTEIFTKTDIKCGRGCNNSVPNPCAWADGWDGTGAVKVEGYGVNIQFYCDCDYEQIICDLSNSFSGELIWLKWQILIFQEQLMSNRFNEWVIYNHEELKDTIIPNLITQYNNKWNSLMQGMYGILSAYRDDCLNCRGIRWSTLV